MKNITPKTVSRDASTYLKTCAPYHPGGLSINNKRPNPMSIKLPNSRDMNAMWRGIHWTSAIQRRPTQKAKSIDNLIIS